MTAEFDALMATTQLEREKADGIKSLVEASKLAAKYQHRAEVAEAALGRVRALCGSWRDDFERRDTTYDDRDDRADARDDAAADIEAALEATS